MQNDECRMIIIYVDGEQILAPVDCIYVPYFERE
jgi:hypothetical protein